MKISAVDAIQMQEIMNLEVKELFIDGLIYTYFTDKFSGISSFKDIHFRDNW